MSEAMESLKANEEHHNLMRLADAQADFLRRYSVWIPQDLRYQFERELPYLIALAYREAQMPLTKQLTDFVMMQNRPIVFPSKETL